MTQTPPKKTDKAPRTGAQAAALDTGLEVRDIGKAYAERPVVSNISLKLSRGEVLGLLGPNGAGKTTCFYIITGLIRADYGDIILNGENITALPMYRRARLGIGYLPQEASIFRGLTVEDNIRAVLEAVQTDPIKREQELETLMANFSISHLRHTSGLALSGGERRRVEIARTLATNPSFILLDEPFAGIDPVAVDDIHELVMALKNFGIGVLITDHNVHETLEVIDRAVIIHDGQVLMEGTPQEIITHNEVQRLYLGERFKTP